MTGAEMLAWVELHGFTDFDDTDIYRALTFSVAEIARYRKWEFLDSVETTVLTAGSDTITGPYNAVHSIYDLTNDNRLIPYTDSDFINIAAGNITEQNLPVWYQVRANQIVVFPKAASDTSLRIAHTLEPPTINASTTEAQVLIPPAYHEIVCQGAIYKLLATNDDTEMFQVYKQLFEEGKQQMVADVATTQVDRFGIVQDVVGYD